MNVGDGKDEGDKNLRFRLLILHMHADSRKAVVLLFNSSSNGH